MNFRYARAIKYMFFLMTIRYFNILRTYLYICTLILRPFFRDPAIGDMSLNVLYDYNGMRIQTTIDLI